MPTMEDIEALVGDFKASHQRDLGDALARIGNIEKKMGRPGFGFAPANNSGLPFDTKALGIFVRSGDDSELKAMSVGTDADGGVLVAPALSEGMITRAFDVSPIGRLARRVEISTGDAYEEPIDADDIGAAWVGEKQARPATDHAELKLLRVPVRELYALQRVTQKLLDDARFDVGAWVTTKINDKFARSFGAAFINGEGVLSPRGLLTYPTSTAEDGARDWFTMQHVNTGHASGFPSANAADPLVDLVYSLRAPYRANARWLMNRKTAGIVRKLKDSEGRFIWADAREGQPATLLGFPVELDEEMPDVAAGNKPIAFGDFRQAYVIVEKPGLRLLRDPFSDKPNVQF